MLGLTEAKKLVAVELITRRSSVQIWPPQPRPQIARRLCRRAFLLRSWLRGPDSADQESSSSTDWRPFRHARFHDAEANPALTMCHRILVGVFAFAGAGFSRLGIEHLRGLPSTPACSIPQCGGKSGINRLWPGCCHFAVCSPNAKQTRSWPTWGIRWGAASRNEGRAYRSHSPTGSVTFGFSAQPG